MATIFGYINVETPAFVLEKSTKVYEIRKYAPQIKATVPFSSNHAAFGSGTGSAFRALAGYIFGKPKTSTEGPIGMTAPVVIQKSAHSDSEYIMSFFMPCRYTKMDQLPAPNKEEIKLCAVEEETVAVIKFSGYASESLFSQKEQELRQKCGEDGVELAGPLSTRSVSYNPPWTLPWLRTNEIHVPLVVKDKN